ncbi:MAG: type II secretion system protein [Candidatus Sericytochromatia bacterium]|nr:type II secretion system protein [Candidatus Sericytochromatia bacterium]
MAVSPAKSLSPRRARAFGAPRPGGFTLIELLIGILVGSIAMSMVFTMFVGSSAALRDGNNRANAVGAAEIALQRLVREIKYANTANPDTYLGMSDIIATDLPLLPYTGTEIFPYTNYADSSGALFLPAAPAARLFSQQVSVTPLSQSRWCPNPELSAVPPDASNSLVYFQVPAGGGAAVHRITMRLDVSDLVRMDQAPIGAGTYTDTNPVPKRQVIMRGVQSVQFTYPSLLSEVNGAGSAAFDTRLSAMTTAARETFLNITYRRLIGIRVRVSVVSESGGRKAYSDLRTSVQVRN